MTRDVRSFGTTCILSVSILAMMGPLPAYTRCVAGCGSLELGGLGTLQGSLDSSSSVRMFRGARFAEPWQRFERAQLVKLWPGTKDATEDRACGELACRWTARVKETPNKSGETKV